LDQSTFTKVSDQRVKVLRDTITDEIFIALGLKPNNIFRKILKPILCTPANHFARIAGQFIQGAVKIGVSQSGKQTMPAFSMKAIARGAGDMPVKGPLLLVTNHPGALDSLALASCLVRSDVRIMVSDTPFMRQFGAESNFFIYVDFKTIGGMVALRDAIAHLKNGGLVIVFAHGEVEPDPELDEHGAFQSIGEWSNSIEAMLRKVPETQLQLGIMSGAVAPKFIKSPLVKLRKKSFEQQKVAEFIQVIQQMIFPKSVEIDIHLSFAKPFTIEQNDKTMPEIIHRARGVLEDHLNWVKREQQKIS
jgi:hypothetical protein